MKTWGQNSKVGVRTDFRIKEARARHFLDEKGTGKGREGGENNRAVKRRRRPSGTRVWSRPRASPGQSSFFPEAPPSHLLRARTPLSTRSVRRAAVRERRSRTHLPRFRRPKARANVRVGLLPPRPVPRRVDGHLLTVACGLETLVLRAASSCRDRRPVGSGPSLTILFNLIYCLRDPLAKCSRFTS